MALYLTGNRRRAAEHVLERTGLHIHRHLAHFIGRGPDLLILRLDADDLTPREAEQLVTPPAAFPYSSGEQTVLDFLRWLGSPFRPVSFSRIDAGADTSTRLVLAEAFGIALGVWEIGAPECICFGPVALTEGHMPDCARYTP